MGRHTLPVALRLLAWQFGKPVVLANLLAWPAAWRAMREGPAAWRAMPEWLNGFDQRIALTTPFPPSATSRTRPCGATT